MMSFAPGFFIPSALEEMNNGTVATAAVLRNSLRFSMRRPPESLFSRRLPNAFRVAPARGNINPRYRFKGLQKATSLRDVSDLSDGKAGIPRPHGENRNVQCLACLEDSVAIIESSR